MIYDLIIIGGGMSGISVAHFFRTRRILILERSEVAGEATGKNAGFIISGFGEHFNKTAGRWGAERAAEIQRIHLSNHRRIAELAPDAGCGYSRTGSLALALDETERQELLESHGLMREAGFSVDWIDRPDTGLAQSRGALLNHDDGCIDGKTFWRWLARDLPVKLESVTAVHSSGGRYEVITVAGTYAAERVIYCLNAFSAPLLDELQGRYIPLRGQMVEYPLQAPAPTPCPIYTQHGDLYWRFVNGNLIFGGLEDQVPDEETGIAAEPSPRILAAQQAWIRQSFRRGLVADSPSRSWCSTMAFTVDGFPFVGELSQPRSYVLAGLCGLGHGYAMECASWLHELIANGRNVIPAYFSSDRIGSLPRYQGGPWRNQYEAWNH